MPCKPKRRRTSPKRNRSRNSCKHGNSSTKSSKHRARSCETRSSSASATLRKNMKRSLQYSRSVLKKRLQARPPCRRHTNSLWRAGTAAGRASRLAQNCRRQQTWGRSRPRFNISQTSSTQRTRISMTLARSSSLRRVRSQRPRKSCPRVRPRTAT